MAEKSLIFTLYWELSSSNSHLNFQSTAFVCNSIPFFKARNGQKGRFLIISYPSNSYFLHASSSDSLFHISWHDQNNCTRFIFTRISLISNFRTFYKTNKRNTYLFIYFFLKARFCMPQLLALKLGLADLVSYCVLCIMYV